MIRTPAQILRHLDHSLLAPTTKREALETACRDALHLGVASVCLLPHFTERSAELLRGSEVRVSTVVAFPHGATPLAAKVAEAREALRLGAEELDVVVNVSLLLSEAYDAVQAEIALLTRVTHDGGAKIKLIFENAYLNEGQKLFLCDVASEAGVDWVKTSTGFAATGATLADVALMRARCPEKVEVKASGGIRTLAEVEGFLDAGATRIGTSRTLELARQLGVS